MRDGFRAALVCRGNSWPTRKRATRGVTTGGRGEPSGELVRCFAVKGEPLDGGLKPSLGELTFGRTGIEFRLTENAA